jgi:hypothetical protein
MTEGLMLALLAFLAGNREIEANGDPSRGEARRGK